MRRSERAVTDPQIIKEILHRAKVMHIGLVDQGDPYVVPVNFGYTYEDDRLTLYFHSAISGRKMDIIKENPTAFCTITVADGLKDGGDNACAYSYHYASIMGQGRAMRLTGKEEKIAALDLLMEHQTGRKGFSYGDSSLSRLSVIRIELDNFTVKMNAKE